MTGGGSRVAAAVAEVEDDLLNAAQRLDDCTRAWRRAGPQGRVMAWCAMIRSLLTYLDTRDALDPRTLQRERAILDDPEHVDMSRS